MVSLFVTCLVDGFFPAVGEAVVAVLERLGHEVAFPEGQTCCGLPLYNSGFHDDARAVAAHTIEAMRGEGPVVVPSGSCGWMLKKIYPTLLEGDVEAARFAERVVEFTQLVADKAPRFHLREPQRVAYHPSCHLLRGLGASQPPKQLLAAIDGLEVAPLPHEAECCGFGGTFAVRHPGVSSAMLDDKLDHAAATGARTLIVTDAGCLLQLDGGARRRSCPFRVRHVAELLAEAQPGRSSE